MINNILVPLDGSKLAEGVLPCVKDLGRRLQAKVYFLHVIEGEIPDLWEPGSDGRIAIEIAAEHTEKEKESAGYYLSQLASSWRIEGIDAEYKVVEGAPAVKIIEIAHSLGIDLIAMSTHGRSGLDRLISGSVADELVREAGIPVLLVKPLQLETETVGSTPASLTEALSARS